MRTKLLIATALTALAAAGAAFAGNGRGGIHYAFVGRLTAAPAGGGVSITVDGGNRAALRAMLGQPVAQTFSYADSTEFLRWDKGVPTVVQSGDLAAGDVVRVNLRAPRGATLDQLEQLDSPLVGDHGTTLYKPTQPLYRFRGKLTAVGDGTVTLVVRGGNRRAVRLLLGQGSSQTFATSDQTIFLLWRGKVPTVIDASQLTVGDRVVVRIRADKGSTLAQVEAAAAVHVGDREPRNGSFVP
jgi:hypothetical protein